jgi:hypothetical protein
MKYKIYSGNASFFICLSWSEEEEEEDGMNGLTLSSKTRVARL